MVPTSASLKPVCRFWSISLRRSDNHLTPSNGSIPARVLVGWVYQVLGQIPQWPRLDSELGLLTVGLMVQGVDAFFGASCPSLGAGRFCDHLAVMMVGGHGDQKRQVREDRYCIQKSLVDDGVSASYSKGSKDNGE